MPLDVWNNHSCGLGLLHRCCSRGGCPLPGGVALLLLWRRLPILFVKVMTACCLLCKQCPNLNGTEPCQDGLDKMFVIGAPGTDREDAACSCEGQADCLII